MGSVTTTNAFDAGVSSVYPSKNYFESSVLRVQSGSKLAYISFARPFNPGSTITRAELVFRNVGDLPAGTYQLTARRQGPRSATYKQLTWDNRPDPISGGVSVTKTGPLDGGTEWILPVTPHVQLWSQGADFPGWEISTTATSELRFYSTDSTASWMEKLEPELRVWYADAPDAPEDLTPSGNRIVGEPAPVLRWTQRDVNGDTSIVAARVQVDNAVTFASVDWDSGEQPIDAASLNLQTLTAPAFPGLPADGSSRFWRVQVKDGAGEWSDWSDPVSVRYLPKGTLTLDSPTAAAQTVSDPTPPILWTLAGATQRAYRLEVFRQHATTTWAWLDVWDSGKITATTTAVTLPKGVLTYDDRRYKVRLTVWDDLNRVTTPTALAAYQVEREFVFDDDAATTPTASISVRHQRPWPTVEVQWTTTVVPDRTIISRDGVILADLEAADLPELQQGDGSFVWVDRAPVPGRRSTYTVRPVSAGKMGWGNPSASVTPDIKGRWLVAPNFEVFIAGTEQDLTLKEQAGVHEPLGDAGSVRIVQGMKSWGGTVTGRLVRTKTATSIDSVSASQWRDRMMRIKRHQLPCVFIAGDISAEASVADIEAPPTATPRDGEGDLSYDCSFTLHPRGRHDWEAYE